MITKAQLLRSIVKEIETFKHLYTKIPAETLTYRPSEEQRNMLELLQYVSMITVAPIRVYLTGDQSLWAQYQAAAGAMTAEEFPATMDRQIEELNELFASLSEETFTTHEVTVPGGSHPLGQVILESVVKWLVGYKMQLFLYLKGAGVKGISTPNLWAGKDPAPKVSDVAAESTEAEATA